MISPSVTKKIALITGAGKGIGLAVSKGLANEGFLVVLTRRKIKKLEEAAKEVGDNAYPLIMDVSDPKSIFKGFVGLKKNLVV